MTIHSLPFVNRQAEDAASVRPLLLTADERLAVTACIAGAVIAFLLPYPPTKYALGAILGLLFLRLSTQHFYIGVALFAFFLPLQVLLPKSILIRGLNPQTAFALYFLFVAFIAAGHQKVASDGAGSAPDRNVAVRPLVCLILLVLLSSTVVSLTSTESLSDMFARVKNWFIYSIFLVLCFRLVTDRREKLFILFFIFIVSALTAAHSLRSTLQAEGLGLSIMHHRAVSMITDQPNLWGGFLAMYLFFFIAFLAYYPASRKLKLIVACATGIVALNLVYTMSRGAWLAFGAAALLTTTVQARRLILPLALTAGVVAFTMPDTAVDRFESGFEGEYDPSLLMKEDTDYQEAASRIIQWRSFIPLLLKSPIFGVGFGQYAETYFRAGYDFKARSAHSSIIELGVEEGLLGLAVYAWLLGAIYFRCAQIRKSSPDPLDKVLALGLAGATVCLLFLDITGTRFRNGNIMAFYWILAGITLNIPVRSPGLYGRWSPASTTATSLPNGRYAPEPR